MSLKGLIHCSGTSLKEGPSHYVSSITYPQASLKWIYKNSIALPKIERVKMVKHREVRGTV
jgi:hypothetical protein